MENEVILVDTNDNPIGRMEKMEAHKKAILHRAVSVFICNSKGEWLLQQRTMDKYHSKGLWANTCCSHPYPGETAHEAANRRLREEMGMSAELKKLFHFTYKAELENGLTEYELDHIFFGVSDTLPTPNPEEVMNYKYISASELNRDIVSNPDKYSAWFKLLFERVHQYITSL